jgi:hypothetical protein
MATTNNAVAADDLISEPTAAPAGPFLGDNLRERANALTLSSRDEL